MSAAPRGWRPAANVAQELAALAQELGCPPVAAEVYLSPRMAARTAGAFHPGPPPRIAFSAGYLALCSPEERRDLMLHELAHYELWRRGFPRAGHGPLFRAMMREWGFSRRPSAAVLAELPHAPPGRLLFVCPAGHEHWLRQAPRRAVSCGLCSRRFDRRHLLRDTGVRR